MEQKMEQNWVFLPVHKSRIIKELDKATLIVVDDFSSTILPKVFRRAKESDTYIYYSLPATFQANIRISMKNEKSRRYEHKDKLYPINEFMEIVNLNEPYRDNEIDIEEKVGENVEPVEDKLPFDE